MVSGVEDMVLIGAALALIFLFVVSYWWSEGYIEASDAVFLEVVIGGLVFGFFASTQLWQRLLLLIPLSGIGVYAFYEHRHGSLRSYYKRRCEEYVAMIKSDPRNLVAREYLAQALYNLGDLDRAIDEIQAAVDIGADMECKHKLAGWTKERYLRDTPNPVCRWCGTENDADARKCRKCGSDLPYDTSFSRWLVGGKYSRVRYYLLLITGIGITAVSLAIFPIKLAFIPLALFVTAIIGWSLISSARS